MPNHDQDQLDPIPQAPDPRLDQSVPLGTGITVLALLLSKQPNIHLLQTTLDTLQNSRPLLRTKLRFNSATNTFSFITPPAPHVRIQPLDLSSTADIISNGDQNIDPYHVILEHELNKNSWSTYIDQSSDAETNVFFVTLYTLSENRWAVVLRLHTSTCDRAAAVGLLRELLVLMGGENQGGIAEEYENEVEVSLGIEDYIPRGKGNKPFWARGIDMLGYSLNSFRLSNLDFVDADSPRGSRVARLQLDSDDTQKLLDGCISRGIKLSGALAAAGLIAAQSTKDLPDHQTERFYHSAIINTHDVSGGEKLWDLAKRCYMSLTNAKNNNKHFTDMGDLNFLMCKAIENPGLTPSSSMRTAFISVFEDPVMDGSNEMHEKVGVEDYVGCSSVHGVGPSVAIFDTIRDGRLDCACVYPSPLHSKDQMHKLIDDMKRILVDGCGSVESES
ncbi:GATA zinc finger domain-containing protein [Salix suchowensis]|nr:GATA zinc finger domain-containing protein [Salix suchowensis]